MRGRETFGSSAVAPDSVGVPAAIGVVDPSAWTTGSSGSQSTASSTYAAARTAVEWRGAAATVTGGRWTVPAFRVTVKVLPTPGRLLARTVPPWKLASS